MEVKGILEKFHQSKKTEKDCFWALEIGFNLVKSAVWTVENGLAEVVCFGETKEWQDQAELLQAVDATLSSATGKLEQEGSFSEPSKVVLGLTAGWIKKGDISSERVGWLKKLSRELALDFVGFVAVNEAVVHRLRGMEGVPLSAVLVYFERQKLEVSLVNLGKIVGSERVVRSNDLGADLVEGLSRIKNEESVFPSRIVIYGPDDDLEKARQEIANYSWREVAPFDGRKKINFLHLPKVEVLESDFDLRAVVLAGGREIAGAAELRSATTSQFSRPAVNEKAIDQLKPAAAVAPSQPEPESVPMGFVRDEDVAERGEKQEPVKSRIRISVPRLSSFRPNFSWLGKINFSFLPRFGRKMVSFLPHRLSLIMGLIAVLLLIAGGVLTVLYWFLPHAKIILFIRPQVLEKQLKIRLDPNLKTVDKDQLILPASKVEVTLTGEKVTAATGSKVVGQPAKGEVIVYNDTSQEKIFKAGTILTSASGIKFKLDEGITVASKSGTAVESVPGKKKAAVTAVEIGAEGNLAAGTTFTLGNYSQSDYEAKNSSAFSGGTSREVQVVAAADRKKLLDDLMAQLKGKAKKALVGQLKSGQKLVDEVISSEVVSQDFDKKVGEEAAELRLNLKLKFEGLSFRESEFKDLVAQKIKDSVPVGFEYKPEENEVSFKLDKVAKNGQALFSTYFKTKLIPTYNLEEIRNNLTGKSLMVGQTYLSSLPHIDYFQVEIKPPLPPRLVVFPRVSKNIKIEVRVKK